MECNSAAVRCLHSKQPNSVVWRSPLIIRTTRQEGSPIVVLINISDDYRSVLRLKSVFFLLISMYD